MHIFIYGVFLLACLSSGDIMAADDHVDPSAVPSQSASPVINLQDRAFIAILGADNNLHLIDKITGQEITKIELSTPVDSLSKIFFTADDKYMMVHGSNSKQPFIETINLTTAKMERLIGVQPKILKKSPLPELKFSSIKATQAFYTGTVKGMNCIFVVNIMTGKAEEVIEVGEGNHLLAVKGEWAIFKDSEDQDIYRINLKTKVKSIILKDFESGIIGFTLDGAWGVYHDSGKLQVVSLNKPVIYTLDNILNPNFFIDPQGQYILFNYVESRNTFRVFNLLSEQEEDPIEVKESENHIHKLLLLNGPEVILFEQQEPGSSPSLLIRIINLQTRQVRELPSLSFEMKKIAAVHTPLMSNRQIQQGKAHAQQQRGNFVDVDIITGGERAAVEPMNREDWRHSVVESARANPNRQALEEAFNNMPNWWHDADNIYFLDGMISGADSSLRNFLSTKRDEGKKMYQELNK